MYRAYRILGALRLRVGDYRAIYGIDPPDGVRLVKIGHRREAYKQ